MRNEGRKRRGKATVNRNTTPVDWDEIHTDQVPCCRLIKEVTADIIPEAIEIWRAQDASEKAMQNQVTPSCTPPASSLFAILLRNHLVELGKNQSTDSLSICKKKRKRKKKKKTTDSPTAGESANTTTLQIKTKSLHEALRDDLTLTESQSNVPSFTEGPSTQKAKNTRIVMGWINKIMEGKPTISEISNQSLTTFIESIAGKNPTISIDEIATHLAHVACERCRKQAETFWRSTGIPAHDLGIISGKGENMDNRRMSLHPSMISPSRWSLPISGSDDDCYEHAFDYRPLEEGYGPTEEYDEDAWLMQSTIDHATTKPLELIMQKPLDLTGVTRLMCDLILPCGLPEVEDPDAYILTDEEYYSILKRQKELKSPILITLKELEVRKCEIQNELYSLPLPGNQDFDLKLGMSIESIDTKCEFLMSEWLKLLLLLTECCEDVNDTGWVRAKIDHFWTLFSEVLDHMMRESISYQTRLLQLASPLGVIPQVTMNAQRRLYYLDLLKSKIHAVVKIHDEILHCLSQDDVGEASFLTTLLTHRSLHFVVSRETLNGKASLDESASDLVNAYHVASLTVPKCGRVEGLLTTQETRTKTLADVLKKEKEKREQEYAAIEECLEEMDTSRWKEIHQRYDEVLGNPIYDQSSDEEDGMIYHRARDLRELQIQLNHTACFAISRWRCIRELQKLTTKSPKFSLPIRLKEWMVSSESDPRHQHDEQGCAGTGGKRRVACIIASLYYKWLVARCKEWHADLVHKELLQDTIVLHDIETGEAKVKPIKRRKKKKDDISESLTVAHLNNDENDETLATQLQTDVEESSTKKVTRVSVRGMKRNKGTKNGTATPSAISEIVDTDQWTPVLKDMKLKSTVTAENVVSLEARHDKLMAIEVKSMRPRDEGGSDKFDGVDAPVLTITQVGETTMYETEVPLDVVNGLEKTETLLDLSSERNKVGGGCEGGDALFQDAIEMKQVGVTDRNGFKVAEEYLVLRFDALLESSKTSRSKINVVYL